MKKLYFFAALMLALLLVGCNDDASGRAETTAGDTSPAAADMITVGADYKIIRSDLAKTEDEATQLSIALRKAILEATGIELELTTDWDKEGNIPEDAKEILVGSTNRPESEAILEGLDKDEYAVRAIGSRIVINATSDEALVMAVSDFISEYIEGKPELSTAKELSMSGSYKLLVSLREGAILSTTPDKYAKGAFELIDGVYYQSYDPWEITGLTTSMQVNTPYNDDTNINCDSAMLYSGDPKMISTWVDIEPRYNIDMMIALNRAERAWCDEHPDAVQTDRNGNWIMHAGGSGYMVPTLEYTEYIWEVVKDAIVAFNPVTIAFEEPEMWNASGFSEGFKAEWKSYFGENWQDPNSSPEALAKSMELKTHLFERLIVEMARRINEIAPETQLYIATHSTVSYNAIGITAGINHFMATGAIDGVIGQTWSDPIRLPYLYSGKGTVNEYLNAYMDFASYVDSVEGTNFFALADPMSDSTAPTEKENQYAYLQTIVASMMHPEIHRFELCPWLGRAFGGVSQDYRTLQQQCYNALNELGGRATTIEAGTPGIYFALSDTVSWLKNTKWAPATSDGFYGVTMPLASAGIPVKIKSMEQIKDASDLEEVTLLILSYDVMLPMDEAVNDAVAEWVKGGGTLLLASGKNEYWSAKDRFWAEEGSPVADLFKKLGIGVKVNTEYSPSSDPLTLAFESKAGLLDGVKNASLKANDKRFTVCFEGAENEIIKQGEATIAFWANAGSGRIVASGLPATFYAGSSAGTAIMKALTEFALTSTDLAYIESNLMTARRGNVVASHAIAEDEVLAGRYIDIYSTILEVVSDPTVKGDDSRLLYDIGGLDITIPRVGFSGGELTSEPECTKDKTIFKYTAASNSTVATRILVPTGRYPESAEAFCGGKPLTVHMMWDNKTSSLCLLIDGKADETTVTVTWCDTPMEDTKPIEYIEKTVATNDRNEDAEYLIENTAGVNSGLRFCDLAGELVYKFDIKGLEGVKFSLSLVQNYIVEVSGDGEGWTMVYDSSKGGTLERTTSGNSMNLAIAPLEYGITDTFYIRISNTDITKGHGGAIRSISWRYVANDDDGGEAEAPIETPVQPEQSLLDDSPYKVSEEGGVALYKRTVLTNEKDLDLDYLIENTAASNANLRYCDNHGELIYRFDLTGTKDFEATLIVCQNYIVEVSSDNENWTLVADYSEGGTVERIQNSSNNKKITVSASDYGFDSELFIRIGNTDTTQGWGGAISKLTLEYKR